MSDTRAFLLGLARPRKRQRYVRRLLREGYEIDPGTFLLLARRFGITRISRPYLDTYSVELDVNGSSLSEGVLAAGSFQNDLFATFAAHVPDRSLAFVNVGANVGTTCLNAHHAGFGTLVAFEPVAANFALLERNLSQIADSADVALHRIALGAEAGTLEIYLNPESTGRHSLVRDFGRGAEAVEVARLDDVAPKRPSVLWVDAEGFEADILRGAPTFLEQQVQGMCLEVTPALLGTEGVRVIDAIGRQHFRRVATAEGLSGASLLELEPIQRGEQVDVMFLR